MQIDTTRFGPMEVDEEKKLYFPFGLLGFPETKEYIIFDHDDDGPFKWLQALDEPDLAFLIMDPFVVVPDYQIEMQDSDLEELQLQDAAHIVLFVILTIPPGEPEKMTANLRGPVVVNQANRWGKQLVLTQSSYHTRHPLLTVQNPVMPVSATSGCCQQADIGVVTGLTGDTLLPPRDICTQRRKECGNIAP